MVIQTVVFYRYDAKDWDIKDEIGSKISIIKCEISNKNYLHNFFIFKSLLRLRLKKNCALNYADFYNTTQSRQSNFIATFLQNMPPLKLSVKLFYVTDFVAKAG